MFWIILGVVYLLFGLVLALADMREPHSSIVQTIRRAGPGTGVVYALFIFVLTLVIAPVLWVCAYVWGKFSKWKRA